MGKRTCVHVLWKYYFQQKIPTKGQLKSQRICFDSSIAQERSQLSYKL